MPELGRTTPCEKCPWRRTSVRGYLGADDPLHFYQASVTAEGDMPCHMAINYDDPDWLENQYPGADYCAGNLIYFRNHLQSPRREALAAAVARVKKSKAVFSWPSEWFRHHMPRATEKEIENAVRQSSLPPSE